MSDNINIIESNEQIKEVLGDIKPKKKYDYKCEHRKQRHLCITCKGSSICEHLTLRNQCIPCKGSSICEHLTQRRQCVLCKGSSICEHLMRRSQCVLCKGSGICEHLTQRSRCIPCKGSSICEHLMLRSQCVNCDGSRICKAPGCSTLGNPKYDKFCFRCFMHLNPDVPVTRNYKTKELTVVAYIKEHFPEYTWVNDRQIIDGCSAKRPDLIVDFGDKIIIIEVDENKHLKYNAQCEETRLNNISMDLNNRPIILIRFNPDGYKTIDGVKVPSCWGLHELTKISIVKNKKQWNIRLQKLNDTITFYINYTHTTDPITVVELFY
jgi:hypothetical protein